MKIDLFTLEFFWHVVTLLALTLHTVMYVLLIFLLYNLENIEPGFIQPQMSWPELPQI